MQPLSIQASMLDSLGTPPAQEPASPTARRPLGGLDPESPEAALFEALRPVRRRLAAEHGVPPYIILSDAGLADLAQVRPATTEVLLAVHGIGPAKAQNYGQALLQGLHQACLALELPLSLAPPAARLRPPVAIADNRQATEQAAAQAFSLDQSLGDVCVQLNRAPSTLVEVLLSYVVEQRRDHLRPWLSEGQWTRIEQLAQALGWQRLRNLYEGLDGEIPLPLLRLAQGFALARTGVPHPFRPGSGRSLTDSAETVEPS